jgi:hypothetical protein
MEHLRAFSFYFCTSTYQHAFECDVECCEYAEDLHESEALAATLKVSPNGGGGAHKHHP